MAFVIASSAEGTIRRSQGALTFGPGARTFLCRYLQTFFPFQLFLAMVLPDNVMTVAFLFSQLSRILFLSANRLPSERLMTQPIKTYHGQAILRGGVE